MNLYRLRCTDCGEVRPRKDMLEAPNPFEAGEKLVACPGCKSIDHFARMCEVVGCKYDGTCGTPESGVGGDRSVPYRHVCGYHFRVLKGELTRLPGLEFHPQSTEN